MTVSTSRSEAETAAIGRALAGQLRPNDVVLLSGNLGAGKTALVRGLAEGLGISPLDVSSPTFTLMQEYRGGRLTLFHVDLYRLTPREVDDIGLDDVIFEGGVTAIEWPDRWTNPPSESIRVDLRTVGDDERTITIDRPNT